LRFFSSLHWLPSIQKPFEQDSAMPDFPIILRHGRRLLLALLTAALSLPALAQSDPPGRIGRIAWISGDVYLTDPETGGLIAAPLNQPLTSGDVVTTGSGARAEIQIGAMTLRIDADSRIAFERIDDAQIEVALDGGRIIANLPTEEIRRDFMLDAGNGRFLARAMGIYRFDRDGAGNIAATAYFGALRFEGRDTAFDVAAGESANVWSDAAGRIEYRMAPGIRDEFTQWSAARDQQLTASIPSIHVSPEMTGALDLETWGDWSETPEYGAAWFPRAIAPGWAPYRDGRWAWIAPWGWTWIGREPWGFAPFHYGRWARVRGDWCWVPGARVMRPVYAPALVGWIGAPGGVSIGIVSSAPVVWFPLAPREVFAPFYRASPAHVRFVNAPHVAHLANADRIAARPREFARDQTFVHRRDPNALNTASAEAFSRTRPGTRAAQNPGTLPGVRAPRPSADPSAPEPRRAESVDASSPSRNRQTLQESRRMETSQPRSQPDTASTPIRRERPQASATQPAARTGTATPRQTFSPDSGSRRMEAPQSRPEPSTVPTSARRERPQTSASQPTARTGTATPRRTFNSDSGSRRANSTPQASSSSPTQASRPVMERPQPRSASSTTRERVQERPRERPRESRRSPERRPEARSAPQRSESRNPGRQRGR
jgi:hypothetical protein